MYVTEAIRHAEPTRHAWTIGLASSTAATIHSLKGDWLSAHSSIEHAMRVARAENAVLLLPSLVASSALIQLLPFVRGAGCNDVSGVVMANAPAFCPRLP